MFNKEKDEDVKRMELFFMKEPQDKYVIYTQNCVRYPSKTAN